MVNWARTIVLTGAMGPLRDCHKVWREPSANTMKNDGWDNLTRAMADVQRAQPGVYIEMGADTESPQHLDKFRDLTAPDAKGVRHVTKSGFVARNPDTQRIEPF